MMKILEDISTANNEKKYLIGEFIDFKEKLDTVDPSISISKLCLFGLRVVALNWLLT